MDHTSPQIRDQFTRAHNHWATGNFDEFMQLMHEDILYVVNVDGLQVPYAMSAVGREDVRFRLDLLLKTFVVTRFQILSLYPEQECITSHVHGTYNHKATGEVLDIKVRFRARFDQNLMFVRLEEIHDALYIEAFERFVFFIESTQTG